MRSSIPVLTIAAAIALAACTGAPSPSGESTETTAAIPEVDIAELGAESIGVEPFADFAVSSGELAWVSGVNPGIVAYDATMTPVFQVETGTVWAALEFGFGAVWAPESTDDLQATTLLRIDATTGEVARFAVPARGIPPESSIAVTDNAVWALIEGVPWTLVALDPATGVTMLTVDLGEDSASAVRGGFGSLWVTRPSGVLERRDAVTGEIQAEIEIERSLTFLAIGPDSVWVINQLGNVFRVDPDSNEVVVTIEASPSGIIGGDIVATADAVWVQASDYLGVQIDPATNSVVQRVGPNEGSGSVAITDDGAVWITAHDVATLYRIPPG